MKPTLLLPRLRRHRLSLLAVLVSSATPVLFPADATPRGGETIFFDDFAPASRGERVRNRVTDAPPDGLGYETDMPWGYRPKHWVVADSEPAGPRRGFWCIPERTDLKIESFLCQAGRSHNSIAFAAVPLPATARRYAIEFRQWCNDNDYIGYIVGASQPVLLHDGAEFGFERQLPGTDQTVNDVYFRGALGTGKIEGQAKMRRWVAHRIEVEGQTVRWFQDGTRMLEGEVPALRPGGHFGIRQRYERGTRYDDVRILVLD